MAEQGFLISPNGLGPEPVTGTCPKCSTSDVTTVIKKSPGMGAWLAGFLCCFVGCCCIPFLMDSFKVTEHYCPKCSAFLGRHAGSASMAS